MGDQDSFQEWLREVAEQIGRSVERLSEVDLDELAAQYRVDSERARAFADAAGRWLTGNMFGQSRESASDRPGPWPGETPFGPRASAPTPPGPHPLDVPSEWQGLALSALDSGRWTVRGGSNQLTGTGEGVTPPDDAADLVGELRARDWITSDGTLTVVGHAALARWCRRAEEPTPPPAPPAVPPV